MVTLTQMTHSPLVVILWWQCVDHKAGNLIHEVICLARVQQPCEASHLAVAHLLALLLGLRHTGRLVSSEPDLWDCILANL